MANDAEMHFTSIYLLPLLLLCDLTPCPLMPPPSTTGLVFVVHTVGESGVTEVMDQRLVGVPLGSRVGRGRAGRGGPD